MTKSDGRPRESLERQATAARTRLIHTIDELEVRRERAIAKVFWFERRVIPALALFAAGTTLLLALFLLRRRS